MKNIFEKICVAGFLIFSLSLTIPFQMSTHHQLNQNDSIKIVSDDTAVSDEDDFIVIDDDIDFGARTITV